VQEISCQAWKESLRLIERNRTGAVTAGSMVRFAAHNYCAGRRLTGFTVQDALSPAARAAKRTRILLLEAGDDPGQVRHFFIDRRRENNPFEAARRNLDWEAIRGACNRGQEQVLSLLAEGYSQNEIASALKRTPGRISQIKCELAERIREFGYSPREV
jgi:hypothetical protein